MPDFTMTLRDVIEVVGTEGIGLSDYPIFDDAYRHDLNMKIINHYWYNEIGHETIDVFVRQLRTKMHEIMPYYNEMYRTKLIEADPLSTMDMRTNSGVKMTGTTTGKNVSKSTTGVTGSTQDNADISSDNSSNTSTKSRAVASETPQVLLNNNGDYATTAQDNVGSTGASGKASSKESRFGSAKSDTLFDSRTDNTGTSSADTLTNSRTSGYSGHVAELIMRWRDSLINIDMMIIQELSTLFMQLWNSGDEYSDYGGFGVYY